ncbi:MAG: DUF11 domain-containing protein, partial [Thermoanaerobaculia bacterium]|nr:DUF11 domain-containing protein [Thermoanaerobaculia bacterium]
TDGGDDEDGVVFGQLLAGDAVATVDVTASLAGLLNAWVDFDADGGWSAGEQIFTDEPLTAGLNGLTFPVPLDAALGTTAARFRIDSGGGLAPTGVATDGEVEDLLVLVEAEADLSIAVTDGSDPVAAGEPVTYTVTVSSAGPSNAESVVVQAAVPDGATLVATSGCAEDPAGAPTCSLGTLGPGSDVEYDLTVLIDSDRTTDVELAVSVSSGTTDPNAANDAAMETTTVVVETDLAVTGSSTPNPMIEGDQLTYTVGVTNLVPSDSTGGTLTLALPAGVVFQSATPGSPTCEEAGGTVTCVVAAIGSGADTSFAVLVDVPVGIEGIISATADVSANDPDPVASNDNLTIETTVLDDMTTIFVDGFESGNTSRWSATEP